MKKFIFIIFFILAFSHSVFASDEAVVPSVMPTVTPEDLDGQNFFRSPMSNRMMPEATQHEFRYSFDYQGRDYSDNLDDKDGRAPFFKQMRIKLTNKIRSMSPDTPQFEQQNDFDDEERPVSTTTKKKSSVLNKVKFWNKKKVATEEENKEQLLIEDGSIADSIQNATETDIPISDSISLETGISEQVSEKEMQLDSEKVNFDEETGDMVATGRPLLYLPPQNTKVVSDTMTYNQDSNILKAIGHVYITKDGMPAKADYLEVDMNEESMVMDNMEAVSDAMIMDAKKAVQKDSLLVLTDGNLHSETSQIYRLSSRMIGPMFSNMILSDDEKALFFGNPTGNQLHFNIENIYVDARKNHDMFVAKNIEVSHKGKYLFTWPSLTAYTNKERDYFEANYPEFGSRRKLGMFIGPGFVFGGPAGSVMKVIPFLNYQHGNFGFGGALKYRNTFNSTELGYGSAADIFFLKGIQRLDDNLYLQYSANSFMDEWFMGARMPKYMAEVYYDKAYGIKDFLAEGKGLRFRHRIGFGLMEDNDKNYYGEKIAGSNISTTRLRYMAEISQKLYSYENPENKFYFDLSLALQGSAAVYGTGDTQFVARIGPRAHVQYKRWMQDIGYFQTGYDDHTPVPRYDMYRYGHSTVYLSEIFRVCKYLSVGWSGMANLSDDSPNGKLFQENRFVIAVGPDDIKIRLGYDFVRQTTYFGFDLAFDTKGTSIKYGKMEIKNPERLGQHQKDENRKLAFSPAKQQEEVKVSSKNRKNEAKAKPQVLDHAQVIDIEDPNKETVD